MSTLSEQESKRRLSAHGVPFLPEHSVDSADAAAESADELGYPVVAKLNGDNIAHKTERGLVRLGLASPDAVRAAAGELLAAATPDDGDVSVLVAPMVKSAREFIAGVSNDPQFGPVVVFGLGGVLAEAVPQITIRLAPLSNADAEDMLVDFGAPVLLDEFRGEPAVDRESMKALLMALGTVATEPDVQSIDLNPVLIHHGSPVAVDALVEIRDEAEQV